MTKIQLLTRIMKELNSKVKPMNGRDVAEARQISGYNNALYEATEIMKEWRAREEIDLLNKKAKTKKI